MRVLYIDVYFLINFTVDLLSLYFSLAILHFEIRRWRLLLASAALSLYATVSVLFHESLLLLIPVALASFVLMLLLCGRGVGALRRIRLLLLFLFLQLLIGGLAHFLYGLLSKWLAPLSAEGGVENRRLLYVAVLILLSLGVLRFVTALLEGRGSEKSVEIGITVMGNRYYGAALVDSGCFLCDPLDGTEVVLIKRSVAARLLPPAFLSESVDALPEQIRKRLRFIPMRVPGARRILLGIRPDSFFVIKNKKRESVRVVLAYDKEEGDYEGYKILIPAAVARNV